MARVNECSTSEVASQFEPETSVDDPAAKAEKQAEPQAEAGPNGATDTFERIDTKGAFELRGGSNQQALRAQLAEINQQRAELKPEIEKAREEALWQMPKLVPMGGLVSESTRSIYEAAKAGSTGDLDGIAKKMNEYAKTAEGEYPSKLAEALAEDLTEENASSTAARFAEGFGAAFETYNTAKDASDVHEALSNYGALLKKDEALRLKAEDIQMKLDPKARFERASAAGNRFSETGEGLVDKHGSLTQGRMADSTGEVGRGPTKAEIEYLENLRRRHGL